MSYKRITKKDINGNSEEIKIVDASSSSIFAVYNRLAELEDKIENGTLIELPYVNVKHKYNVRLGKYVDIFNVYYKDVEGDIILCVCLTAEEAEEKIKRITK